MATTTKAKSQFENRVRFNWGYHDAANAKQNNYRNFGFCNFGPLADLTCPADVVRRHHDPEYAQGWQQGWFDAEDGFYEGNSEAAWQRCLASGLVAE